MKLSNYLIEQRMALEMEDAIVTAWNTSPSYWPRRMTIGRPVADNVCAYLRQQGVHGKKARKVARKGLKISKDWQKYGARDNTPKTDIKIGTYNISLKTGPSARLMSGGKNESSATFHNVMDKVPMTNEAGVVSTISSMIDQWEDKIIGAASLAQERKKGKNIILNQADQLHRDMTGILESFFEDNVEFRNAFAREAMSGEIKFGAGSKGTATHILKVLDPSTGKKNRLHSVDDSSYVGYIAKQMNLNVHFKTSKGKGKYRYWSVLSLAIDKMNEEYDKYEGHQLNEGIISAILMKIRLWLQKLFEKVKLYISKGVGNIMEFLEIAPTVKVKDTVKF